MAKHLTDRDVTAIINTINGWGETAFTWEGICEAVAPLVGKRPTRQSLSSNSLIKIAYSQRVKTLKKEVVKPPSPSSLAVAANRMEKLETEMRVLRAQNQMLLEQFVVWQYNASIAGLTVHQLNNPLPRIDRERSVPLPRRVRSTVATKPTVVK